MRPAHRRAQIVRDHALGDPAEKPQRARACPRMPPSGVGGAPVRQRLRPGGPRVRGDVARRPEHRDEHLRLAPRPALSVHDGHRVPGVVDEQLLAGAVVVAHDHINALAEGAVALAELAVLKPLGMLALVLLPQQRQGDPLAPQLGVNVRPIRHRTLGRRQGTAVLRAPARQAPRATASSAPPPGHGGCNRPSPLSRGPPARPAGCGRWPESTARPRRTTAGCCESCA